MKAKEVLEENYEVIDRIDLKINKKQSFIVNGLSVILMVVLAIAGHFMVPVQELLNQNLFVVFVILISSFAYIVLHEAVHGIAMKIVGAKKIKFGFNFLYAYAGSDFYFDKKSYIFVALAPIVTFLMVFTPALMFVPKSWFWVLYIVQIINISGSSGDLFVVFYLCKHKNIFVQDSGYAMNVYGIKKEL